jgi:hypothetical protein
MIAIKRGQAAMNETSKNGWDSMKIGRAVAIFLTGAALLSACATPEARVRTGLMNAGLSDAMATCMADHMVNELSLVQLKRLSDLGALKGRKVTAISVEEFIQKTRSLRDTEILIETTKAAGKCVI